MIAVPACQRQGAGDGRTLDKVTRGVCAWPKSILLVCIDKSTHDRALRPVAASRSTSSFKSDTWSRGAPRRLSAHRNSPRELLAKRDKRDDVHALLFRNSLNASRTGMLLTGVLASPQASRNRARATVEPSSSLRSETSRSGSFVQARRRTPPRLPASRGNCWTSSMNSGMVFGRIWATLGSTDPKVPPPKNWGATRPTQGSGFHFSGRLRQLSDYDP